MKNLFNFSRGEIVAVSFLLLIIVVSFLFSCFYHRKNSNNNWNIEPFQKKINLFIKRQQEYADSLHNERQNRKIQGAHQSYVHNFDRTYQPQYNNTFDSTAFQKHKTKPQYTITQLNINLCDTGEITAIPQLGTKRSKKIVEYRQKLGGFHSFEQLSEVYILQNIDTEHWSKYFFIDVNDIKKLKVNSASYKELIAHPYFDSYLTKTILNYRQKNGKILNIIHFKEITKAYPELIEKIEPYLSFE